MFPGVYIPPIPPHKSMSTSNDVLIFKRKQLLIKFTAAIARSQILLKTPIVEGFYKISDYKEFLNFQKAYKKKIKRAENIEQFITIEGNANCDISFQGPRAEKLAEYVASCESIEKKLKRQSQYVINDMRSMQTSLSGLSELVHQLEEAQNILPYTNDLKRLYGNLTGVFANLSTQESLRSNIFQEYYNLYFKYSYLEKNTLKELLKERDNAFNEYSKAEIKQKNIEKCRNFFGYVNTKSLEETENAINKDIELMNTNFIKFSQAKGELIAQLHEIWLKLMESLSTI